jgi:hypothetical protein
VALMSLSSCKKSQTGPKPVASLADTTAAAEAFDHIRIEWARNDPGERPQLRRDLDAFIQTFPADGLNELARIYRVLSLMEPPTDWPSAERRLEGLPAPPPGSTHDLYIVAVAKLLRYHHQPEDAFELLRPLVGSIVGSRARAILQEELTFDALESREPYEAIAYMDAWLRGASEEETQASEAKVAVALGGVPEAALRGSLESMRRGRAAARKGQEGASHGYGKAIERLITERLGQIAVERGDAELARWLLDADGSGGAGGASPASEALLGEEIGSALGQLATSRRGIGTVAGRTVGLVLPTSSADLRDEVADVLRGVLWALEIGRESQGGKGQAVDRIRLVTRDDGGDVGRLRSAMEEVAGEGASVIITALDPDTAAEAADWANKTTLNVIVLAAPASRRGADAPSVFDVGEDWSAELSALGSALGDGASAPGDSRVVATLGDAEALSSIVTAEKTAGSGASAWQTPISCDLLSTRAGDSRFPLAAWARTGVKRWLVAGSVECATDLLGGLHRGARGGVVGLSLEASDILARARPPLRVVCATAGIVPLALAVPTDPRVLDARVMADRTGAPEGWWAAVGHDAGVLAKEALARLPSDTVSDAREIARRREQVRRELLVARAPLWTSDQQGFDPSTRTLLRTIRVVELDRAPAR